MPLTRDHRARGYAILCDAYGDDGWTIPAGHFHRAARRLEKLEQGACERAVQIETGPALAVGGYNNPLDGRDLSTYPVAVRVAYVLTERGDDYDAPGAESGAATLEAIEDRANLDLKWIRDRFGRQGHWTGLDPTVIDPAPLPEATREVLADRVIYTQPFTFTTKTTLPGSHTTTVTS